MSNTVCTIISIAADPTAFCTLCVEPRLFNSLPQNLRHLTRCTIDEFKTNLYEYLAKIPDEPNLPGYRPSAIDMFGGQATNCLVDQIRKCNQDNKGGG